MKNGLFFILLFTSLLFKSYAQNDDCSTAISITSNTTSVCNQVVGNTAGATQSAEPACTGNNDDDVWYKFVASSTTCSLTLNASASFNAVLEVFSGSCGALTSLFCVNNNPFVGGIETTHLTGLTIGNTYFIRVYDNYSSSATTTFSLCLYNTTPPPNDDCANAIAISSSTTGVCTSTVVGDTYEATQSAEPACTGINDDDVWYKFVASSSTCSLSLNASASFNAVVEVFSGSCGALTSLFCVNNNPFAGGLETTHLTGLTIGNTYYIRVYDYFSSNAATTTFSLCLYNTNPPPNDDCANAIAISSSTTGVCTSTVVGDTYEATQSAEPACTGNNNDDVWYKFVASSSTCSLTLNASASFNAVVEVLSGSCGALTNLLCINDNPFIGGTETAHLTGLTIGNTYFIRVYDYYYSSSATTTFSLCLYNTTPPPNDDCANAIAISSSTTGVCTSTVVGDTYEATQSAEPACTGINDDDVWYKFVASSSTCSLTLNASASFNAVIEVFSGSCGALTSLFCVDNNPFAGGTEYIHLNNLTIGNTYYIRVFDYFSSNAATTTFSLCLFDTSPPANDECAGAFNVTSALSCGSNTLAGTSMQATQSSSYTPCAGNNLDDVWYKFTAVGTTQTLSVVSDNSNDIVVEVMSGACSNLTSIQCIDGAIGGGTESFVFGTLTAGNNYYFRIYQYNYSPSVIPNFTICLQNSFVATPSNDNCSNAQTLTVTSICTQTPTAGNTFNATQYLPGCSGNANDDVWYKFVATSTDIKVLVRSNPTMDAVIQLFDGNCSTLTSLVCADNASSDTLETLTTSSLTIGQTYYLRVYDYSSDPGYPFTIAVITNEVKLNSSNNLICLGSSATLSGTGATSYTWSTGATSPTVVVTPTVTSTYSVAITTTSNCTYVDSVIITVSTPVTPDICIVTSDTSGTFNEIYWEKIYANADSFIVYREVSTGTFQRIGAVDKDAYSMYTDTNRSIGTLNGDPNLNSYKYKLQIRDTCGNYGGMSLWHQTVHMQDLQNGTFNWNYYGIETLPDPVTDYEFRRIDVAASTETLISNGIMNTDVDPLYASYSGNANIKWVVDGLGFNCNPTFRFSPTSPMAQKVKTKSNQANEFIITKTHDLLKPSQVKVYPNPAKEKVVVNLGITPADDIKVCIETVLGQTLIDVNAQHSSVEINTSHLTSGIYFVCIKQKNKTVVSKKLIIQ